ncbi:MAG: hypothetical protein GYA41_10925 [Bacteroidales bacterium]|nr:hypothetical protein [Bacteroidales bacterium]
MIRKYLPFFVLFVISYVFLQWFAGGIFFYQEQKSLFVFSTEYLQRHLIRPGGILKYIAAFITQGYLSGFFGALINSLIITLLSILSGSIAKRLSAGSTFSMPLTFLMPLGVMLCQYDYHFTILHSLGFLTAACLFFLSVTSTSKTSRLILIILFPVFYFVSGSYSLLYLGMWSAYGIINYRDKDTFVYSVVQIAAALLTIIVFYNLIFFQPLKVITGYPFLFNEYGKANLLLYTTSAIFITYPALIKISSLLNPEKHSGLISALLTVLIFGISIFVLIRQYNPVFEGIMRTEKMFFKGGYDNIISHHERNPSSNIIEQFYYNLSLSEKGKLCDRMFFGRQDAGPMSLSLEGNREQASRTMHYYYAIGLVNEARHLAFELMVNNGYSPENLKMLIKTELINGNFRVAARYVNVLKRTLGYRSEAAKFEKMLFNPEIVRADPELGEKMKLMPEEDFFIHTEEVINIEMLLKSHPRNRKAFEYKMARLLLEKDIIEVAKESVKMKELGYSSIPRHIEEAIVAWASYSKAVPDLNGLTVSSETNERFVNYVQAVNRFQGDKALIEKSLSKKERNTFWFYLQFGKISVDFSKSKPADRNVY